MGDALFIDISSWQSDQVDWRAYNAWSAQGDGISRVEMRCSYGVGYKDEKFEGFWSGAINAGTRQIGVYHYAYPQYNSPEAEADWCWQVIGNRLRPGDFIMLDYEEDVVQATADWAYRWLVRMQQNSGRVPYIYSYLDFVHRRLQDGRLAQFPLVLADWTYNPDVRPAAPAPWGQIAILQYSNQGTAPGFAGRLDLDVFLGAPLEQPVITINDPTIAQYFHLSSDGSEWIDLNGNPIYGGILADYQSWPAKGNHNGFTVFGLPKEAEHDIDGFTTPAGKTKPRKQRFERGTIIYDPDRIYDNPPGATGNCYAGHVDEEPAPSPPPPPATPSKGDALIFALEDALGLPHTA